jgi:hypothetical protein
MKAAIFAMALAASSMLPAHAAVTTIPWWTGGGWTVNAIPSSNKCMAQTTYTMPDGSHTTLSFDGYISNNAAILVDNPRWDKLFRKDTKYWVNVSLDGAKPQRLLATSYFDGGIVFNDLTFDAIKAFAEGNQIRFSYKGRILASLNLPGSWDAVDQTIRCIRTMQNAIAQAGSGGTVDDGTGPVEEEVAPMQATPKPAPAPKAAPAPAPKMAPKAAPATEPEPKAIEL